VIGQVSGEKGVSGVRRGVRVAGEEEGKWVDVICIKTLALLYKSLVAV
jgi:hypothetical protein